MTISLLYYLYINSDGFVLYSKYIPLRIHLFPQNIFPKNETKTLAPTLSGRRAALTRSSAGRYISNYGANL